MLGHDRRRPAFATPRPDGPGARRGGPGRLLAVVGLQGPVALAFQNLQHRGAVFGVILNDEDGWSLLNVHIGSNTENVDPLPGWVSTSR